MLSRRLLLIITLTVGLIAVTGLVIFSPFALATLVHLKVNWLELSNIGQTYGAVSALLSSLALAGVIASLLYQSRSNKNAVEQRVRTLQFDLLRMAMTDPTLMTASGAPWDLDIPSDSSSIRQFLYVQLWVSFLSGSFAAGDLPESALRYIASHEIFRSEAGRNYWAAAGQVQTANSRGGQKRFFHILDDEYNKAMSSGIPTARPIEVSDASTKPLASSVIRRNRIRQLCKFIVATVIGILAGRFWRAFLPGPRPRRQSPLRRQRSSELAASRRRCLWPIPRL